MFGVLRPPSPPEQSAPSRSGSLPPPRSLAPMPPSDFSSREDLLAGTKDWAASQGYAIVIARSRSNRLWLKCDRGGNYENRRNLTQDQRKRKRGESRLLGCPFRMLATVRKDGTWRAETDTPEHNHGPSEDLSAHPTLRRMNEAQLTKVQEMYDTGRSPAETVEELKTIWPEIKVLTRDIYNARKKYKTQKEEADRASGVEREPLPDPNGVFPGPDENGRWAWVPDGEEVTNKKTKRRRKTAPATNAPNPALDPQLQTPGASYSPRQPTAGQQQLGAYHSALAEGQESAPHRLQHQDSVDSLGEDTDPFRESFDSPNQSPSRLRSQQPPINRIPATAVMTSPAQTDPNIPDSPAALAARIERMEKEQRDQKNTLAQILGAVKGISGSSTG